MDQLERGDYQWKPLGGGWRNACFLVRNGQGERVAVFYRPGFAFTPPEERARKDAAVSSFLSKQGFPVRRPLKVEGSKVLFDFLPGMSRSPSPKRLLEMGRMLSNLHFVLRQFPWSFENSVREGTLPGTYTVLHGDFARGNVLFDGEGEISGVLDFEFAQWGPPVVDVAQSLALLIKDAKKFPSGEVMGRFLRGYQEGKNVLEGEGYLSPLVDRFSSLIYESEP